MLRVLFTGGGTGGHIYPILSVAEELQIAASNNKIELDLRYFGVPGTYHNYTGILIKNGIKVSKILSGKWRRYFNLMNIIDIPKLAISFIQSLWLVFWFMPDVLFSKGGPGSVPVVLACRFYRVPIIIHESDSVPSVSTLIAARYAKRIGISFPSAAEALENKNVALVGNPIRRSLLETATDKETAKKILGFNPAIPIILVLGSSQGSTRINNFFLDAAPNLLNEFQIINQVGDQNFADVKQELYLILKELPTDERGRYKIVPYFEKDSDLKDAYAASDIVISRAGAGNIFEIAALGKPAILIPLPEAANNHQVKNAYEYEKTGAAIVIEEANLKTNIFLSQLKKLFSEPGKLEMMSQAAKNFAKPKAASLIAQEIIKIGA